MALPWRVPGGDFLTDGQVSPSRAATQAVDVEYAGAQGYAGDVDGGGHADVQVRLYEELNEGQPADHRKRTFPWTLSGDITVGGLLRSLVIDMLTVDLALVNGQSAGLGRRLSTGDRVSLYPVFEAFDISPLMRLHARPLRKPRFLVTDELEGLARSLRKVGFDVRCLNGASPQLLALSEQENRTVLSSHAALLRNTSFSRAYRIRNSATGRQIEEVFQRFDLHRTVAAYSRLRKPRDNIVERY